MNIRTMLAAAAAGAALAIPLTAGAISIADSPDVAPPCGVDSQWMDDRWNDPEAWDDMQRYMEEHWDDMQPFMEEHWDDMGPHMFSGDFGPGMMGEFGPRGGFGTWRSDGS